MEPADAEGVRLHGLEYTWPGMAAPTLVIDDWAAARGDTVFVQGPSGCGKSTLLGLLSGVLVAAPGMVSVLGTDWAALRGAARDARRADDLGVIFQQFNLLPYLSVLDNVRLPCRFSARRAARCTGGVDAAARRLLASMELPETLWLQPAARLSVGQQQRVAAARALIGAPALVLADEPTSALDAALRDGFMAHLLEQVQAAGSTLIFVSHDERLAARFSRRLALPELNRAARVPA
ncbi:MAG: ATP-binding cassette domain-containing protein [Rubrivivax sp.]|nr:ATP-binding cassette domain-containing protein [Rubrivivax sp.]